MNVENNKDDFFFYHKGLELLRQNKAIQAEESFRQALQINPNLFEAYFELGTLYKKIGRLDEAIRVFSLGLKINPYHLDTYNRLGNALQDQDQIDDAIEIYDQALKISLENPKIHFNRGNALKTKGNEFEAITSYQQCLKVQPDFYQAHNSIALILCNRGDIKNAIKNYQKAIEIEPSYYSSHFNIANAYCKINRTDLAILHYEKALALQKTPDALFNLGMTYQEQGKFLLALSQYKEAIVFTPDYIPAHFNIGFIYQQQRKYKDAIQSYLNALEFDPQYDKAYVNLSIVFNALGDFHQAIHYAEQALKINPSFYEAHFSLGNTYQELGQLEKASRHFQDAYQIKSSSETALQQCVWMKRHMCEWTNLTSMESDLISMLRSNERFEAAPFPFLALTDDPKIQLTVAQKRYGSRLARREYNTLWKGEQYKHNKIRIAYLSADYHEHATAYLMAEFFELHDRSNFELFAISFGQSDSSWMRQRIIESFDHFIDVKERDDKEIAQLIRELEIDITVDLKGYTKQSRPGILAHRPAPIQVNYLGYPGTMGVDFIDYILVDSFIVPPNQQDYFSEKLVHLPRCYQVNDSKRPISKQITSRKDHDLPSGAFVFCCFNNSYKITPSVFDIWMRLLKNVPNSVLWLFKPNPWVEKNLRNEAQLRGVDPMRLIFASSMNLPEHLERHRHADLFLDCFPCSAHTTASDALWAGLPLLTCSGESFAARVAGSLLKSINLPELITYNLREYEDLALELSLNPKELKSIKQKLELNRQNTPLFDCLDACRTIELEYQRMVMSQRENSAKGINKP